MTTSIKITEVAQSKANEIDFYNIVMGTRFSDHMFVCDYQNGEWQNPRIEPLALIPTHPAAMALHYGQAIFEGMKATLGKDGTPLLFRPKENAKRLNFSANRMGMPSFPEYLFVEALKQYGLDIKDNRYKFETYEKFCRNPIKCVNEKTLLIIDEAHNFRAVIN